MTNFFTRLIRAPRSNGDRARVATRPDDAGRDGQVRQLRRRIAELEETNLSLRKRLATLAGADQFRDRYLGETAKTYDANRSTSAKWKLEHAFVDRQLASLQPGASVLDIPVGTGRFVSIYKARGLKAVGLDSSPDMLAEAAAKARTAGLDIDLRQADALALPYRDPVFDAVVCVRMLNFFRADELKTVLSGLVAASRGLIVLTLRVTDESVPLYAGSKQTIVHPAATFDAFVAANGLTVVDQALIDDGKAGRNIIFALRR
jgi:predicted TPR repeat methyltransferase